MKPCICGHIHAEHVPAGPCLAVVPARLNDGTMGSGPCGCAAFREATEQGALL